MATSRDIGAGSPYSMNYLAEALPPGQARLMALFYFLKLRSDSMKLTQNFPTNGRRSPHSFLCVAASLFFPYRYRHQLTSASLLAISPLSPYLPSSIAPKLKLLVLPCIYLTALLAGLVANHYFWRLRATFNCSREAAFNAFLLYRLLRTEGAYDSFLAIRPLKQRSST